MYFFYLIEQHSKFLLHTLQVLCMCTVCDSTGLFKMIVWVLTNCHTQHTWDRGICSCTDECRNSQSFLLWCAVYSSYAFLRLERSLLRWRRTAMRRRLGCLHFSIVLMFVESQRVPIENTCKVCNKNLERCSIKRKNYIYSYVNCIVYDKLLKPRQSFRIILYFPSTLYSTISCFLLLQFPLSPFMFTCVTYFRHPVINIFKVSVLNILNHLLLPISPRISTIINIWR